MTVQLPPSAAPRSSYPVDVLPAPVRDRLLELAAAGEPVASYVYDSEIAALRARELRAALPEWASVYYAVKANAYPGIVEALAPYVEGFEVASAAELELALYAGSCADLPAGTAVQVVAAGPAKPVSLLTSLVRAGVEAINAESVLELHRISRIAVAEGVTARVALRVNPAGTPLARGVVSQFGVAEPDVPEVLCEARALPGIDLVGFHIHAASGNLDAEAHAHYLRWCVEWSAATARAAGIELRHVDVGGGIGVPAGGELPFDVVRFGELVRRTEAPAGVKVILEPGRFLVADCGWYAAEVTDVKTSYGVTYAVLRGGIHHFQLPISRDAVHNVAVLPVERWDEECPRPVAENTRVTVVGELCTPEDTLLRDVLIDRVRAGDLIVFPYAGSYGWEFAPHAFLGHPVAERYLL
ncbi:alanine racemase [Streptomyces sp. NPDC056987]|uniref:alanine racemase n=1 Tax=Streptomyces sp. NPDC056987 TaxID=3345988 RepID=UPI00363F92D4